jgi:two-component system sensor histidine kinase KdpD
MYHTRLFPLQHLGQGRHYLYAAVAVGASVAISALLESWVPTSVASFSLVFLLGVLVVAAHTALGPALTTAVLGFLAFNYFFTEPRYTFVITRPDELVAATLFLVTGLIGGNLANRLRRQVAALHATNEQSRRLLMLHDRLSSASTPEEVHTAASDALAELTGVPACSCAADEAGAGLRVVACTPADTQFTASDRAAAERAIGGQSGPDVAGTSGPQGPWRFCPLRMGEVTHGAIGLRLGTSAYAPTEEELQLLAAYATQVATALTRAQLTQRLEEARIAEETERLRSALLSSVSHDLRTPLSSIIGAASSLRDLSDRLSDADRQELLDGMLAEGQRLDRYIGNLLDMTRLGQGPLPLQRDWAAPADLIGVALRRTRDMFPELKVDKSVPADLPLLSVHGALIEQALVNVIENAARCHGVGRRRTVGHRRHR